MARKHPEVGVTLLLPQDMMNAMLETASRAGIPRDTVLAAGVVSLLELPEERLVARLTSVRNHLAAKGKRLSGPRVEASVPEPVVNRVVALSEETGLDGSTIFALGLQRLTSLLPERGRGPAVRERVARYRDAGWL